MNIFKKVQTLMLGTQYDDSEYDDEHYYEDEQDYDDSPQLIRERERERDREREKSETKHKRYQTAIKHEYDRESNVVPMPNMAAQEPHDVFICKPKSVDDASTICERFRDNAICIVSLEGLDNLDAQRIADVLSGAAFVLDGDIQRITNCVFILAPKGYNVSNELKNQIKTGNSFLPWLLSASK